LINPGEFKTLEKFQDLQTRKPAFINKKKIQENLKKQFRVDATLHIFQVQTLKSAFQVAD
jgi:hypothetical protein